MQSKTLSIVETVTNTILGIIVGVAVQMAIFPLFGINDVPLSHNFTMALIFAGTSILRGYIVRRCFNKLSK